MSTHVSSIKFKLLAISLLLVIFTGAADAAVPSAPATLTASATLETQVALSWSASSGATSYNVYRSTSSGSESSLQTGITTTTFEDTSLNSGQTYFYKV